MDSESKHEGPSAETASKRCGERAVDGQVSREEREVEGTLSTQTGGPPGGHRPGTQV